MTNTDRYGIVANNVNDRVLRRGARCRIQQLGGGGNSIFVRGLSKGGRRIEKWVRLSKLENFRVSWVHESERNVCVLRSKEEAQTIADNLNARIRGSDEEIAKVAAGEDLGVPFSMEGAIDKVGNLKIHKVHRIHITPTQKCEICPDVKSGDQCKICGWTFESFTERR